MRPRGSGSVTVVLVVVASAAAACTTGVRASDVEQACREDAECVVVEELEQVGARCTVPCQKASIHRQVIDKYNRELARERQDCVTVMRLACDPEEFVAECRLGRCIAVTPSAEPEADTAEAIRRRARAPQ